ncbi:MAG: hypothetical protein FIA95_06385, partial [Gemmatimonadetes bacterium]|nr:hypothetical protein [Gemmatimonadota bacterium]
MSPDRNMEDLLGSLQERAKELRCLYQVTQVLNAPDVPLEEVFGRVLRAMPYGWQYPGTCRPMLRLGDRTYRLPDFQSSAWVQAAAIRVRGEVVGELCMYYAERREQADDGPFLKEERQLLESLADRIGLFQLQREGTGPHVRSEEAPTEGDREAWRVVVAFLQRSAPLLLRRITTKMTNLLRWRGIPGAQQLLQPGPDDQGDENRPSARTAEPAPLPTERVFAIAEATMPASEILRYIEMWIAQDKVGFLLGTVEEQSSSLPELTDALERFQQMGMEESELPASVQTTVRVALLRRFFTDQLAFINIAKQLTSICDFQELVRHVLHPSRSHGKLGGKSAGLFLARKIVEASGESASVLKGIQVPRTWYITSDALVAFVRHNNLDDVHDRKYLDVEQVRQQYPHVVQVFKSSAFPPEIVQGLSAVLDDVDTTPLVVRSS